MTFLKLITFKAIFILGFIICCHFGETTAQVGDIPACTNFTCRRGECEQLQSSFQCHCYNGVKGINCDRLFLQGLDEACLSNPCWNRGVCQSIGSTDFRCVCPSGTSGKNCRTISSAPCLTSNQCQNNAVCQVVPNNINGYFCFCVNDWTGQFCETPIPLCNRPNPCFNGGTCSNNVCVCPTNFFGARCETNNPVNPLNGDKIVKVLNKGWYIAHLRLTYEIQRDRVRETVVQTGSISSGQDFGFRVPFSVNYDGATGCILEVNAVAGAQVMRVRIRSNPECFDVWGGSLTPSWSSVNC